MLKIGQVCVKIAGRDAGKKCVIVDIIDNNYVLIDGETRRRKCNVMHIEPLDKTVDIKKGASHADVAKAVSALKWKILETKKKPAKPRPRKARRSKLAAKQEATAAKPAVKPTAPAAKPTAKPVEKEPEKKVVKKKVVTKPAEQK